MKNKKLLFFGRSISLLIGVFVIICGIALNSQFLDVVGMPAEQGATNDNQRIVQEVAKAFYLKGDSIQYDGPRRDSFMRPEDLSSQSASNTICSGFVFSVYYNAFGIMLPKETHRMNGYARDYYGKNGHEDVVFYQSGADYRAHAQSASFYDDILGMLQVGDIITYRASTYGHAALVYDIKYEGNRRVDAAILHAVDNYERNTTKIKSGLSWNDEAINDKTGVDEGAIKYIDLETILGLAKDGRVEHFTIYRPLALSERGEYNHVTCSGSDMASINCNSQVKAFNVSDSSKSRLKYPGIEIEKIVDVANGSVVEPGDILTYTVRIKNNSSSAYKNIVVKESIVPELVSVVNENSDLEWQIESIPSGATKEISYSVMVKNDPLVVGRRIVSTGTVAGISSTEVVNTIGNNLSVEEQNDIKIAYNRLKGQYQGIDLVDEIYKSVFGSKLGLSDFELGVMLGVENSTDVQNRLQECNPYINNNETALLRGQWGLSIGRNEILNNGNDFSKNILNNYYSALFVNYTDATTCDTATIIQKYWEEQNDGQIVTDRSERATRIYPETLMTGDVLLYENTGSKKQAGDPKTHENGLYAFMWIEDESGLGNFYGINSLYDGEALNVIYGENGKGEPGRYNLQTLFGKDFYVILRPSLTMSSAQEQQVAFSETAVTKSYGDGSFINEATTSGNGVITYASSNNSVATVNSATGEVTITGVGQTTITAVAAATDYYNEGTASYTLTINKANGALSFQNNTISKAYGDEDFTNAINKIGDGVIMYSVDNTNVATVNPTTGKVKIVGVGTAVVTAEISATERYNSAITTYNLIVSKASQTVSFTNIEIKKIFGDSSFVNEATTTGDGEITYSSDDVDVATVDSVTGEVTIKSAGTTKITANASASANYNSASGAYTLVVDQDVPEIAFNNTIVSKTYGDANFTNVVMVTGDGKVNYSSSDTNVATVDSSTGEVTIKSAGTTKITASIDSTTDYLAGSATYELVVRKKTSTKPSEVDEVKAGRVSNNLATIILSTDGLIWENMDTEIKEGHNGYTVKYTENNDESNYTTETFEIIVNGEYEIVPVPNTSKNSDENEEKSIGAPNTGGGFMLDGGLIGVVSVPFVGIIIGVYLYRKNQNKGHRKFD